jgi:hypothetical protein
MRAKKNIKKHGRWPFLKKDVVRLILNLPWMSDGIPIEDLMDVALKPELMLHPESDVVRDKFWKFYAENPDSTLALLAKIRDLWKCTTDRDRVCRYLRMHPEANRKQDGEIATEIKKQFGKTITTATVKKARQYLARKDESEPKQRFVSAYRHW